MTQLSTLDLQKKLLAYYEEHTEVVRGMDSEKKIQAHLLKTHLSRGACHLSERVFGIRLTDEEWVTDVVNGRNIWYTYPMHEHSKPDILTALTTRIDILKSIIAESEPHNQTNFNHSTLA